MCDKTRETCLPISETFFELFAQPNDQVEILPRF